MSFDKSFGDDSNVDSHLSKKDNKTCLNLASIQSFSVDPGLSEEEDGIVWNTFGEDECGEPMAAQHLVLDFAPNEKEDTKESQQKCIEFFRFLESHPEIHHLMANPEPCFADDISSASDTKPTPTHTRAPQPQPQIAPRFDVYKTAVSELEICEREALLTSAMETKMYTSMCSMSAREYPNDDSHVASEPKPLPVIRIASKISRESSRKHHGHSSETVTMCKQLQEWDVQNPKSFDPPRRIKYD